MGGWIVQIHDSEQRDVVRTAIRGDLRFDSVRWKEDVQESFVTSVVEQYGNVRIAQRAIFNIRKVLSFLLFRRRRRRVFSSETSGGQERSTVSSHQQIQ